MRFGPPSPRTASRPGSITRSRFPGSLRCGISAMSRVPSRTRRRWRPRWCRFRCIRNYRSRRSSGWRLPSAVTSVGEVIAPDSRRAQLLPDNPPLRVVRLDPRTDRRWEAFVGKHPDGLIYHHPNWLRVLTREYPVDPVGLACEDLRGQLRGVLPLLPTRGLPLASGPRTTRRLSSVPRTPVAGPLALDDAARRQLVQAALQLVQHEAGTRLEIKAPLTLSFSAAAGLLKTPWRLSYSLALPPDPSPLRLGDSRSHGRTRWALNKAQKLGVRVRPAESVDDLRRWYAIHLETMRWHSVPPRPSLQFQAVWGILG